MRLPSLFEDPGGVPGAMSDLATPESLHCAPVGWPTIRSAVATVAAWFEHADPALFVSDVSAEMAQLARIASVPTVAVLQHGDRSDPGHRAAYQGAAGLLAPYAEALEQPERPGWMCALTHYAPGIGVTAPVRMDRAAACARLGLDPARPVITIISGAGGGGVPLAPLTMGARARPDAQWIAVGQIAREWHETVPGNLRLDGWTTDIDTHLATADIVCSSAGNTLCHQPLASGPALARGARMALFRRTVGQGRLFAQKWGYPTMKHWIRAFRLMRLVERVGERVVQVRAPGPADLALSEQRDDMPYANFTRVIRLLEARLAEAQLAAE